MNIILIITLLFFVLTIRLSIKVIVDYNIIKNEGKLIIKLYFLPIIVFMYDIQIGYLNFNSKNKTFKIKLELDKKMVKYIKDLKVYLFKNLYITNVDLYSFISLSNNCEVVNIKSILVFIQYIIFSKVKHNNDDTQISFYNDISFFDKKIYFNLNLKLFVSILDILLAFIKAGFNRRYVYGK